MPNSDRLTLMAVHAHPDDESSSTGGVLARYSDEGVQTVVVTCTNGEYGDGPDHVKPGEDGHDPDTVAKTRLAELETACTILGVSRLETLGYHDSGMPDWPYKDHQSVFCNVPMEESVGRLVRLFTEYRPDVVVTYDAMGGYNHPDHLQAHNITVAAVEQTGIPAKLYFISRRRRDWEKLREQLAAAGVELPAPPQRPQSEEWLKRMEEMEKRITTTVDTSKWAARKRDALVAHASQLDQSWWTRIPAEAFGEVFAHESFIRAEDRTGAPVPEEDLFAGLR
ncbi:MAG TPA: PIG-L family deacetylase [Acidimicrobiales bacterium]|nr:PIG-L family deacetylase [Acidimicrobiales bacterium]